MSNCQQQRPITPWKQPIFRASCLHWALSIWMIHPHGPDFILNMMGSHFLLTSPSLHDYLGIQWIQSGTHFTAKEVQCGPMNMESNDRTRTPPSRNSWLDRNWNGLLKAQLMTSPEATFCETVENAAEWQLSYTVSRRTVSHFTEQLIGIYGKVYNPSIPLMCVCPRKILD